MEGPTSPWTFSAETESEFLYKNSYPPKKLRIWPDDLEDYLQYPGDYPQYPGDYPQYPGDYLQYPGDNPPHPEDYLQYPEVNPQDLESNPQDLESNPQDPESNPQDPESNRQDPESNPQDPPSPFNIIIVTQLPLDFNRQKLTALFSQYGPLENVYTCDVPPSSAHEKSERIARMTFRHEHDASRAMEAFHRRLLRLDNQLLVCSLVSEDYSPIAALSNDCLYEIFCRVNVVEDKFSVEKVCQRWRKVSSQGWPDVTEMYNMAELSWRTMVRRAARSLRHLALDLPMEQLINGDTDADDSPYETLALVAERCTKLRSLGITWNTMRLDRRDKEYSEYIPRLEVIISRNKNLRQLYLREALLDEGLFDWLPAEMEQIHIEAKERNTLISIAPVDLSRFSNLQGLGIYKYNVPRDQLLGIERLEHLSKLKFHESTVHSSILEGITCLRKLKHLAIGGQEISNWALARILRNNPMLEFLDISDIEGITDSAFENVATLPELEELMMSNLYHVTFLPEMPNLKVLKANGCISLAEGEIWRFYEPNSKIWHLNLSGCNVTLKTVSFGLFFIQCVEAKDKLLWIEVDKELNKQCQKIDLWDYFIVDEYSEEEDRDLGVLEENYDYFGLYGCF